MTSQEPRDEPPPRPPDGTGPRPTGERGQPDPGERGQPEPGQAGPPEPDKEASPEQGSPGPPEPDKAGHAEPDKGKPAEPEAEQKPPRSLGPPVDPYVSALDASPPQSSAVAPSEQHEGVPYWPDPYEENPYLAESPTRTDRVRTEQMRRNAEYHESQRTEAPPYRAEAIGRFKWEAPIQTKPTDPIWPFVSRIKRKRRSDWPVLVFALVVAAIVTIGCCLGGFATFAAWNPFGG